MRGIAVGVARGDQSPEFLCEGTDAAGRPITEQSLFPVASLTKLATALAVLRLADAGRLAMDDPLASHIPEAVAAGDWDVTVRRLLSHTSGLPLDLAPEIAPYAPGLDWPALADACIQTPLQRPPAKRVQYSNVGYGLLAIVVEREMGQSFASSLDELVLKPLGIEAYLGTALPRSPVTLAGVRSAHAKSELEPFNSRFWQSLAMPWGGLLTTPAGALALARAFAGHSNGFLRPATLEEATRNQNGQLGGGFVKPLVWEQCPWGLGVEVRGQKQPHWTPLEAGATSFGHSGASGCVAWYDPVTETAWTILGTRTADSGWLIRRAPVLGAAILAQANL
jgi:CubicO group peptidase (beta-lactamase class C family)